MSNYRNELEKYLGRLEIQADRVIDVGGGALPVKDRVEYWDVKTYHHLDNNLEPATTEIEIVADLNRPLPQKASGSVYDIVFCLEVMEYIHQPQQAITNLNYLTKPGGTLYVTFPFIYPVHNPKEADMLRYTADAIAKLLGDGGFLIEDLTPRMMTVKGYDLWRQFLKAEGMHASKYSRHDVLGWIAKAKKP